MRRRIVRIIWAVVLIQGAMFLTGMHWTARLAAGMPGRVVRTMNFRGGRAMLLASPEETYVAVVRRWGPFWHSGGGGNLYPSVPGIPAVAGGWATTWNTGKASVTAFGGYTQDRRVTHVTAGDQTQGVDQEGNYLFVWRDRDIYAYLPAYAVAQDGTVLYEMDQETVIRWRSAGFDPKAGLDSPANVAMMLQALRAKDSLVSPDGAWHLAMSGERQLILVGPVGRRLLGMAPPVGLVAAWAPDGARFAFVRLSTDGKSAEVVGVDRSGTKVLGLLAGVPWGLRLGGGGVEVRDGSNWVGLSW
jgi:hypothetical protein